MFKSFEVLLSSIFLNLSRFFRVEIDSFFLSVGGQDGAMVTLSERTNGGGSGGQFQDGAMVTLSGRANDEMTIIEFMLILNNHYGR